MSTSRRPSPREAIDRLSPAERRARLAAMRDQAPGLSSAMKGKGTLLRGVYVILVAGMFFLIVFFGAQILRQLEPLSPEDPRQPRSVGTEPAVPPPPEWERVRRELAAGRDPFAEAPAPTAQTEGAEPLLLPELREEPPPPLDVARHLRQLQVETPPPPEPTAAPEVVLP